MNIKPVLDLSVNQNVNEYLDNESFSHILYLLNGYQLKNAREIKASVKNRSSISGGGAKPYKQKGTGSARRGSNRTHLRRGGAVAFGPRPRVLDLSINKKVFNLAYKILFFKFNKLI